MRGIFAFAIVAGLVGCAPRAAQMLDISDLPECPSMAPAAGPGNANECRMMAGPQQLRMTFDEDNGGVRVDVVSEQGALAQTFTESDVAQFVMPTIQDIDGDGRADILVARATGNVNTQYGVWLYNGADNAYRRAGEVSGVEFSRTSDGYLAASARSSAASWEVAFYRIGAALEPLVTVSVAATDTTNEGQVAASECTIQAAPGLASLNMTEEAARAKFCAEPQAGVFQ